jgi:hypothetical protein
MAGLTALLENIRLTWNGTVWGKFRYRAHQRGLCRLNLRVRGETRV